jgi:hypothetical protein
VQLATLVKEVPKRGSHYLYELKYDGYVRFEAKERPMNTS